MTACATKRAPTPIHETENWRHVVWELLMVAGDDKEFINLTSRASSGYMEGAITVAGATALHLAAGIDSPHVDLHGVDAIMVLVRFGGDPLLRDALGRDALAFAKEGISRYAPADSDRGLTVRFLSEVPRFRLLLAMWSVGRVTARGDDVTCLSGCWDRLRRDAKLRVFAALPRQALAETLTLLFPSPLFDVGAWRKAFSRRS
uniref:Uncharacterized protein n=1 Tax=Bicosoecida sp. CB-2014 TaxID=1486930 RepID=A0A7S1CSD2_9STRA|mmetsp:Transcript_9500/g.33395  ORF Transcript_9500/g.33395 Transcript_9500/m.33395 type:complete len:203 (+) Transcript_9500:369-977(+)